MAFIFALNVIAQLSHAADGKLIGTAGLVQLEGSGGGGLVPWATLSGYDSRDQISFNAAMTRVDVTDYRLDVLGISASFYDRLELSLSRQRFNLKASGTDIDQTIFGAKYRLYGDAVYSDWPQVSIGLQHKELHDGAIAGALGADDGDSGTDFYLSATKVHLGAVGGYNGVWNLTTRATKANEMGLLGFGGADNDSYELMIEASVGVLFSRHLVVGTEYREKPDNLNLNEDDWKNVFISYIPSKNVSFTLAWAELGAIAGASNQQGWYLSVNGQLW